jgi:alpha-galactosidase
VAAAAPALSAQVPSVASVGQVFTASVEASGVLAISYRWDFGDGITEEGPAVSHTYTRNGDFTVQLKVVGLDGPEANQSFTVKATGSLDRPDDLLQNRRYTER